MNLEINGITVDFTADELDTLENVYGVPSNTPPRPLWGYEGETKVSVSELREILGDVEYVLSEEMNTSDRVRVLRFRKELKAKLECVNGIEG